MSVVVRLEEGVLRAEQELAALQARALGDGAVVSFTGIARSTSRRGNAICRLVLEHHPTLTLKSMNHIAAEAAERFDVSHVHVVHRFGDIAAGEPIVFAGAAARHRRQAFEAVDYLMDSLKTDAVFWKRESGEGGSEWIEPTEFDYADRQRWG